MKQLVICLVLGNALLYCAHAQSTSSGSTTGSSGQQQTQGSGGGINLGTTEDGQEGYMGAIGGQGAFPYWGGAGIGMPYQDGGVQQGIGQGIGSGSSVAFQQRLQTGRTDQLTDIPYDVRTMGWSQGGPPFSTQPPAGGGFGFPGNTPQMGAFGQSMAGAGGMPFMSAPSPMAGPMSGQFAQAPGLTGGLMPGFPFAHAPSPMAGPLSGSPFGFSNPFNFGSAFSMF